MIFNQNLSSNQKKLSDKRFRPWRQQLKWGWQAAAAFMTHSPAYRPAGELQQSSAYPRLARFYPFCPPIDEQKAWLERCYRPPVKF